MAESDKNAVYIEIRYEDGSVKYAEGDDAEKIVNWWNSCETLNFIHGATYAGPFMKDGGSRATITTSR